MRRCLVPVKPAEKHSKTAEEYALSLEAEVKSLRDQAGADKELAGALQNEGNWLAPMLAWNRSTQAGVGY